MKTFKGCSDIVDNSPVLLLAPTGVAAININGTTIHNGLGIPLYCDGASLPPLGEERKTVLRVKLSNLRLIIIDEISMVSNDRLVHIHERLIEIFSTPDS